MNLAPSAKPASTEVNWKGGLPPTLAWEGDEDGALLLLDQTRLPRNVAFLRCLTAEDVWHSIKQLSVRGAPAIGVSAAYGLCLGTRSVREMSRADFLARVESVARYLESSRPTAVNLSWAVRRVARVAQDSPGAGPDLWRAMLREARRMDQEDREVCRRIGEHGAPLIPENAGVLTHCNAGALATVAWGTALSLMYVAHEQGRPFRVYADETRPLLQGARLTAFELASAGIDVTVICDGAAASLMRAGLIQMVVVGADRIAANGDTANKIGTYSVALAARQHGIPFYVAAPMSTIDLGTASGAEIPIEERSEEEVRGGFVQNVSAAGVKYRNPAFDVTPADFIGALITERGLVRPVTAENIQRIFD